MVGSDKGDALMMYGWHQQSWGAGAWSLMAVGMIVFWSLVVMAIVLVVRHFGSSSSVAAPNADPHEEFLRARFAHGEIDEDEFSKRLSFLRNNK
jgi:putative membrane protein